MIPAVDTTRVIVQRLTATPVTFQGSNRGKIKESGSNTVPCGTQIS